jgi:NAD(P)-dependent dehydrogenase (short-subunit alcohol dehydrogenase family)
VSESSSEGSRTETTDALVVGAGGGIGSALVARWRDDASIGRVWAVSRGFTEAVTEGPVRRLPADHSEAGIARTLETIAGEGATLSRIVIALGTLHGDDYQPEKSLEALRAAAMEEVYRVNCVLPLLWVAGLGSMLRRSPDCRIAVLSARVGSIGDNRLGGWYSYRCAKAALNMGLKSAAIELARRAKGVKLIAFHPGTVDTALSRPFQKNVAPEKLFEPAFVAERLDGILASQTADGELSYLDWAGKTVPW